MVLEVQITITRLNSPLILHLSTRDLGLLRRALLEIPNLEQDQQLGNDQRAQGKAMAKHIRAVSVDLPGNDTGSVAYGLLHANGSSTTVVGCYVDIEPGNVEARTVVDSNGAEESGEEFDCIGGNGKEQDVTNDAKDVGEEEEGASESEAVGIESSDEKTGAAEDVNRNGVVLGLQGGIAEAFDNGWQEGAEAIEKNILTKLNATTEVNLGVAKGYLNFLPAEVFTAVVLLVQGVPNSHEMSLLLV